jgi:hypothetical protein
MLALSLNVCITQGQQMPGREIAFPKTIRWSKQRGVTRYRLQIAGDAQFQDVIFDAPVTSEQYVVNDLASGYYYWRVAPVASHPIFSPPLRFFISGGVVITVTLPSRTNGIARR